MPGVWCTRGLVCSEESTRVRNHRYAETIRHSLHNGFTAYTCSPQGPALLPLSPARSSKQARTWHQHRDARTTRLGRAHRVVRPHDQITLQPDAPTASRLHVRDDRDTHLW